MTDRSERTIEAARRSFNDELLSPDFPRIHGDDAQVTRLVDLLDPRPGGVYLDLATGNGDVALAIAGRQTAARVVGIDIADRAIARNRRAVEDEGRGNVEFRLTDGRRLDFPDTAFDGIACRYALHHFPDAPATLADARRVLRTGGALVVADAVRHPKDEPDFINRFQALKPDGHVRIYTADDLVALIRGLGFAAAERFGSAITFSRALDARYRALIEETPPEILELYAFEPSGDEAILTFEVLNVRFLAAAP